MMFSSITTKIVAKKITFTNIICSYFSTLINQGSSVIDNIFQISMNLKLFSKIRLLIFLLFWIPFTWVLLMAFTAVLRNSYFNTKLLPIVSTLDDIIESTEILVEGNVNFIRLLHGRFGYDEDKSVILNQKLMKYREYINTNMFDFDHSLQDLIDGKIAYLIQSNFISRISDIYHIDHDQISISHEKYFPLNSYYKTSNNHYLAKEFQFW